MRISLPKIDSISFWFGFILSSVLWWIISVIRPAFRQMLENARARKTERREISRSINAFEERYRQMVFLQAQAFHLAAPLFSLDEIIIPPRLLAPPHRVEPGEPVYSEDIVDTTIPYLPGWPQFGASYAAPTLSLAEALSGNSDIVLVGQAGIGKTVAIASLASRIARRDIEEAVAPNTIPFLAHIADLDLPIKNNDPLYPLIELISNKVSVFDLPRVADFIRRAFSEGLALILLDGTDELPPDGLKDVVDFIRAIKRAYPKTRMVTAATDECLDGLVSLNFIPISLASWDLRQRAKFIQTWGDLWNRHVAVESWAQTNEQIDPFLLNGWLSTDTQSLTPLELTLRTWAAYAGDIQGHRPIDAIETHLRRISPSNAPREALELLALQSTIAIDPIFDPRKARQWVKSFESSEIIEEESIQDEQTPKRSAKLEKQKPPSLGLIAKMVESGLLIQHRNNRIRFIHPVFAGYLAGKNLVSHVDAILQQPSWVGKHLAMNYLTAEEDTDSLSEKLPFQFDRPLYRNILVPARWLRDMQPQLSWRTNILSKLRELLQQNGQPLGLRGQAVAALINSGDPGTSILFRQLLISQDAELLQLAALGCGILRDLKSVDLLIVLLRNQSPNVSRSVCMALVRIGTTAAIDAVASALLHGDEILRRAAAESLSLNAEDGYQILREGAEMQEDLEVRRAVCYGLGRINQSWSEELLTKLQIEDDQWVVRNAASEMLEEHKKKSKYIPNRLPPPSESPWLLAYAGKQGMGISPDVQPTDLLLAALKTGSPEEQLASLAYIRIMPTEGIFSELFNAMYGDNKELREAVYQTIAEMSARGINIPDPVQFGVGY